MWCRIIIKLRYIATKKDDYKYRAYNNHKKLMTLVINRYKILRYYNIWKAKTTKEIAIMDLHAKINKLKDENLKLVQ